MSVCAPRNSQFPKPTAHRSCNPIKVTIPVPATNGYSISDALKQMLIDSVACGDANIAALVAANFDVIECLSGAGSCKTPDVQLIHLQVGLADFALDQARNFVDRIKTRGSQNGETHFRGSGYRDAEASKASQGTSVFKSRANSINNFTRTSAARETSSSTSRAQSDGSFLNVGSDRSTRKQNSSTTAYDKAKSVTEGTGDGCSNYLMHRENKTDSQTGQNPGLIGPTVVAGPEAHVELTPDNILLSAVAGFGIIVAGPIVHTFMVPNFKIGTGTCGAVPNLSYDVEPPLCNPKASRGFGGRSMLKKTGNWSMSIPVVGTISSATGTERSTSIHEKFEQVCSRGFGKVEGESNSCIRYIENTDGTSKGETHMLATGEQQQAVQRSGTSTKTSASKLHAESTGSMDSCGESHSQAQRLAHGDAQNTGTSQSRSEFHDESNVKFQSVAKAITEARYFNQIFKQLAELRKLLFKEMTDLEARKRASLSPVSTCAKRRRLTAPPLFYFGNTLRCGRCLKGSCNCAKRIA